MQLTTVQNCGEIISKWKCSPSPFKWAKPYLRPTVSSAEMAMVPITHGSSPELSLALVQTPLTQTS